MVVSVVLVVVCCLSSVQYLQSLIESFVNLLACELELELFYSWWRLDGVMSFISEEVSSDGLIAGSSRVKGVHGTVLYCTVSRRYRWPFHCIVLCSFSSCTGIECTQATQSILLLHDSIVTCCVFSRPRNVSSTIWEKGEVSEWLIRFRLRNNKKKRQAVPRNAAGPTTTTTTLHTN